MSSKESTDYGIKYSVKKVNDELYILTPIDIVEGYSVGETFYSNELHKTLEGIESLNEEYLIDSIASAESLKKLYDYDDLDFVKDFYLEEEKDFLLFVEVKDKKIVKRKINLSQLIKIQEKETYERQKDLPVVTLNCDAVDNLLNSLSIQEVREKLEEYRKKISQFREREKKEGLTSITVENGHISEINLNKKVQTPEIMKKTEQVPGEAPIDKSNFSVSGLYSYLKERVMGHDEELQSIATTLIMNYRSTPEFGTESILIVGPTGTGKTETIQTAARYLNIPYTSYNTANLVPQGIKGTSLEDLLYTLLVKSNFDIEKAQRGLIFLDEFDKLGRASLDIKESVKDILLTYIAGGTFNIDKPSGDYEFNTTMLNKTFAGAFQELFEEKSKQIGFGTSSQEPTQVFKPSLITKENFYEKEIVTRIQHIHAYLPLTRELQRKVMLESKLSQLLLKKQRYEKEFGVTTIIDERYVDAILDQLAEQDKSMRDLNNLIIASLSKIEFALLNTEGKCKTLILSRETVENPKNFDLR